MRHNIFTLPSTIRQLWMDVAVQLKSSPVQEHQELAQEIPKFVESMPQPLTERHWKQLNS